MDNITLAVVKGIAYRMGFKTSSNRAIFFMISSITISYLTLSLITTFHKTKHSTDQLFIEFISIQWYGMLTPLIFTAIFTTNFVPYLGDAIDILINRCCRKKTRSKKHFDIEKKLTQRLLTILIVFTFGYGMPVLFPFCLIPLTFTLILDKYLIIYWLAPTIV